MLMEVIPDIEAESILGVLSPHLRGMASAGLTLLMPPTAVHLFFKVCISEP